MATTSRLLKAIDLIERHLEDDFRLTKASEAACYSHYHFLRLFLAVTGMTVGTYVRRRRLTKASVMLLDKEKRIIEIAQECCFDSQASFSRAFKEMFGKTPAAFRREKQPSSTRGQPIMTEEYLQHLDAGGVTMNPRFVRKEAFTVVGLGRDFNLSNTKEIGKMWDAFRQRMPEIKQREGDEKYGICYAASKQKEVYSDQFHYIAAVRVSSGAPVPKGMESLELAAQDYAVFTHKGVVADLHKTNHYIWKTWLPRSKLEPVCAPDFECYDGRWPSDKANSEIDIYIPIVK